MKKTSTLKQMIIWLCLIGCAFTGSAQDVHLEWARQVGGSCWNGDEDDVTQAVAVDDAGNVYSSGYLCGTMDFDPGPGTHYVTSSGSYNPDLFVYKLDATGALVWVKMVGTNVGSWTKLAIAADSAGNVYTTGTFFGAVDFDPGPDSFKLGSATIMATNAFVLKLDSDGEFAWVKHFETAGQGQIGGLGIALDETGNVLSTGRFFTVQPTDFNPGTGTADTFFINSQGSYDIYIAKLSSSGDFVWVKSFGAAGDDQPTDITIDVDGNTHTTGKFKNTVDFDPGVGVSTLVSTGYEDAFILKLDNSGNFIWVKGLLADGTLNQYNRVSATGISTDAYGNVYTKGAFGGTVDFDPGPLSEIQVTAGPNEMYIFVSKFDNLGNFLWVKRVQGGWGVGIDGAVVSDTAHHIYITGSFEGTSDFDPGAGVYNLTAGAQDIYVAKWTDDGDFVWAKKMGGYSYDRGYDIAVNPSGKCVYTAGSFAAINGGQADFDPGADTLIFTAAGNSDGFIQKMSCNTYGSLTVTSCDSFTFNGLTYLESGIYVTQVLANSVGCDSIITIDLTLTHSTDNTTAETACGSFTANGQVYTTSGIYLLQTLANAAGCDSLLLLDLTITEHNTDVTQTGNVLTAAATGVTYQWINCNNGNNPVAGATQQTFTAANDGSYAVIITKNGCSDTSTCYTVAGTGINGKAASGSFSVYPNPVSGLLTISAAEKINDVRVKMINIIGQVMQATAVKAGKGFQLDMSAFSAGTYILEIETKDTLSRLKIVKE